jgi:ferredoxin-like protein FixX
VIDLCTFFLGFCEDESCGRCTTCHGGTQRAVELLRRMSVGGGRESDLDKLEELVKTLVWSNCLHGQFAMTTIKLALRYFRDEFETVIRDKRDPAQSLAGLIRYRVTKPDDASIAAAAAICPVNAFIEKDGKQQIDDDLCVRCGACKELAPTAIEVVDRFRARTPAATAEVTAAGG